MMTLILAHGGEILLRTKTRQKINTVNPLVHCIVPTIQTKVSSQDLLSKAERGSCAGLGIAVTIFKDQIAEGFGATHDDPVLAFVVKRFSCL